MWTSPRAGMWKGTNTGLRLGVLSSVVGIILALLDFSVGIKVASTLTPDVWWNIVLELIPLAVFAIVGGIARRRGEHPLIVGLWAGLIYGTVAGLASFLVAVATPNKSALINALWTTYLRLDHKNSASSHAQLVNAVLHPNFSSFVVGDALHMALLACIFALLGGMIPFRPPAPKDQERRPA